MSLLEKLRDHFCEWQSQGYYEKPDWYDQSVDDKINALSNVELIELLEMLNETPPTP